jgi:hypothetical protein
MDLQAQRSETRFSAYVEGLVSVIGHADRALSWSRLSEQNLRVDKWSLCRV